MNDFEKSILKFTKELNEQVVKENLHEELSHTIESESFKELAPEDKAALMAVASLRASLVVENAKEVEPKALWSFIRYLTEIEMPMRIVDLTGILYPGNEAYYSKALTPTAFKIIQRQATLMIEAEKYDSEEHKKWLEDISNGKLPYGYSIQVREEKENEQE